MNTNRNNRPRVVVTGLGTQSPLGAVDEFWENLKAGKSGIRRTSLFDPQELDVQVAGEVDFEASDYIDRKSARRMSRASQLTLVAARMALEDSGMSQEEVAEKGGRVAVTIGNANAGFGSENRCGRPGNDDAAGNGWRLQSNRSITASGGQVVFYRWI